MSQKIGFADALEAAEQLDLDTQAELVAVLTRRLAERGRSAWHCGGPGEGRVRCRAVQSHDSRGVGP